MTIESSITTVLPGEGLVHRGPGVVLTLPRLTPDQLPQGRALLEACRSAAADPTGRTTVLTVAGLLSRSGPTNLPAFGLGLDTDQGLVVLLHDEACAEVHPAGQAAVRLRGTDSLAWVERRFTGAVNCFELWTGPRAHQPYPGSGPAAREGISLDLSRGTLHGAGLLLVAAPQSAAAEAEQTATAERQVLAMPGHQHDRSYGSLLPATPHSGQPQVQPAAQMATPLAAPRAKTFAMPPAAPRTAPMAADAEPLVDHPALTMASAIGSADATPPASATAAAGPMANPPLALITTPMAPGAASGRPAMRMAADAAPKVAHPAAAFVTPSVVSGADAVPLAKPQPAPAPMADATPVPETPAALIAAPPTPGTDAAPVAPAMVTAAPADAPPAAFIPTSPTPGTDAAPFATSADAPSATPIATPPLPAAYSAHPMSRLGLPIQPHLQRYAASAPEPLAPLTPLPSLPSAAAPSTPPSLMRQPDPEPAPPTPPQPLRTPGGGIAFPRPNVAPIEGVLCARGHFTDPSATYCAICGISMQQVSRQITRRPRPTLGVLVLDDGTSIPVDSDLVIGRDPSSHPAVVAGDAKSLFLNDEVDGVSRVHARITLVDWSVCLTDEESANGTYLMDGNGNHTVRGEDPVELASGSVIRIGRRTVTFDAFHSKGE